MAKPTLDLSLLKALPIFKQLAAADLDLVARSGEVRRVEESSYFYLQGDPATYLYVLTYGRVRFAQVTVDGQQVILKVIGPSQMFGGIAMLPEATYPVSAMALEDAEALAWSHPALQELARHAPQLALNSLEHMSGQVQDLQARFRELATERVERRLARVVLRLASQVGRKVEGGVLIDLALSRQDLAEMIGTTLYSVSRILSEWERQGYIETGRERVLVHNPHALMQIAEDLP